ncbi:hypothetical protein [Streptomyces cyaneofuscatus]|uniref:hypothetical protein n=1 Tax=Streptomyces cyaneofuscatus TaxID=66883 RepID=UPI003665F4C1
MGRTAAPLRGAFRVRGVFHVQHTTGAVLVHLERRRVQAEPMGEHIHRGEQPVPHGPAVCGPVLREGEDHGEVGQESPAQSGRVGFLELHRNRAEFGDQRQPGAQRRLCGVHPLQVELDAEDHGVGGEPHQWVTYPFFEMSARETYLPLILADRA